MAFLRVEKGRRVGQIFELVGDRIVIGRLPSCQVVLDLIAVSRRHAQILASHGSFLLEDLHSPGGTFLNGVRIREATTLKEGDAIRVCEYILSFHNIAIKGEAQ